MNMVEKKHNQEFSLKSIYGTRSHLTKEMNQNELINKKQKKRFILL